MFHGVDWEEEKEGGGGRWGGRQRLAHYLLCDILTRILPNPTGLTGGIFDLWAIL